ADIVLLFGNEEAPQSAHVSLDCEAVELLQAAAALRDQDQRFARQRNEVGLVRGHTNIMKTIIGEQRLRRVPSVTGHATAFAVEQSPSALGAGVDGARGARRKPIEGRIEGGLRAFISRDRLLDIVHRYHAVKYRLE